MTGKASRAKGARGQTTAANLLRDRDWVIDQVTAGISSHDFTGTDLQGKTWAIEVKNCAGILPGHKKQAMEQGKQRRLPWMLMNKIAGSSSWLIQRQGEKPCVWHEKDQSMGQGGIPAVRSESERPAPPFYCDSAKDSA